MSTHEEMDVPTVRVLRLVALEPEGWSLRDRPAWLGQNRPSRQGWSW